MMQVVYRGHLGKGPHPEEKVLRQAASRAGLSLATFTVDSGGYQAELHAPDQTCGNRHNIVARIDLHGETLAELVAWVERYGRGEAWG